MTTNPTPTPKQTPAPPATPPILNHIVTRHLTHNGTEYLPGSFIQLSPKDSDPLIESGTVSVLPSEGERGSMITTDNGHTFHCQGPMSTVDGGKSFSCQGCGATSIAALPASDVTIKHIGTPVVDNTPEVPPFFGTPLFGGKQMVTTDGGYTFHCAGPVVTVNNGSTFSCESCTNNMSEGSDQYVVGLHHGTPVVDRTPDELKNPSGPVPVAATTQLTADKAQGTADDAQFKANATGTIVDQSKADAAQASADDAQAKANAAKPIKVK